MKFRIFNVISLALTLVASISLAQASTLTTTSDAVAAGAPATIHLDWDDGQVAYQTVGTDIQFPPVVTGFDFTDCPAPGYTTSDGYFAADCTDQGGGVVRAGWLNLGSVPTGRLGTIVVTTDPLAVPGDYPISFISVTVDQEQPTEVTGTITIVPPPQPAYDSIPTPGTPFIFGGVQGSGLPDQPLEIFNLGEPGSVLYVQCSISLDPDGVFFIANPAPFELQAGESFVNFVGCDLNNPVGPHPGELLCISDSTPQFGEGSQEAFYPLSCEIFEQPAILTVEKIVENGTTGGTLGVGDFALFIDGAPVTSGNPNEVAPGVPHFVSETPEPGYVGVIGGDCDVEGGVVLEPGQSATCTITNTAQQATLTVIKVVENGDTGATAVVGDFDIRVDSVSVTSGATNDVDPGLHVVSEIPVPGYDGVITGDCTADGQVTLALGEEKTCTITNTAQQATLTVIKVVDNGGTPGPLDVADFDLFIDADQVTSGVANDMNPGTYTVSETPEDGYTGVISGDCNLAGEVTLGVGENKTCTITNTRDAFALTVTKIMQQPAFPDLFIMDANGTQGTPAGNGATSTAQVLYGDVAYINELAGVGTDLNFWNSTYQCVDVTGAVVGSGAGHMFEFTMPAADVDCTITNDRKREQVTFVKETIQLPDGEFCFNIIDVFGNPSEGPCIDTSGGYGSQGGAGLVGHYRFNEIMDGSFALISASCDNGQNPEQGFDLIPGEPLTCTWVNGPAIAIPVNNPWALLLLALMVLGIGWYFRPATMRRH